MAGLVKRFSTGLLLLTCAILCLPTPLAAALATENTDTTIATAELSGGDTAIQQPDVVSQLDESVESTEDNFAMEDDGQTETNEESLVEDGVSELAGTSKDTGLLEATDHNGKVDVIDDSSTTSHGLEQRQDDDSDSLPDPVQYSGLIITRAQLQGQGEGGSSLELIELRNNSQEVIDITDWGLYYTKAVPDSDTQLSLLAEFKSDDLGLGIRLVVKPGDYLLFVSNEFEAANPDFVSSGVFKTALANGGGRLLIVDQNNQLVSGLAWGSGATPVEGEPVETHEEGYLLARKWLDYSSHQDTRQNQVDFVNDVPTGGLYHVDLIVEMFDACLNENGISDVVPDGMYRDETTGNCGDTPPIPPNSCQGLTVSEIGANLDEQFIELRNSTDQPLELDGCRVSTNHSSSKDLVLGEQTLDPGGYHVITLVDTELRINKTTSSKIYVISQDGNSEVDQTEYSDLKPDTSWSLIDGAWQQTFAVTPGAANQYLAHLPCEAGYIRNLDTGRCNKLSGSSELVECNANQFRNPETGRCKLSAAATSTLTPCDPGQFRNPSTNRCKSLTTSTSQLQPCDADQFRNPATNRCKQIASAASTLKACQPGQERNPETNRCRKAQSTAAIAGASFPVEEIESAGNAFVGWWALGGVLVFGLAYAGWEWRHEISKVFRRG